MHVCAFLLHFQFFCLDFIWERACAASWLNCARVRNLFQFKQDALIAEAQSQITSIHSSESWLIGVHGVKRLGSFMKMPNVCNKSDRLSHHEQVRGIYSCGFSFFDCCRILFLSDLCCVSCWQQSSLSARISLWQDIMAMKGYEP